MMCRSRPNGSWQAREQITIQKSYLFPSLERAATWKASAPRRRVLLHSSHDLNATSGLILRRPLLGN